MAHMWAASEDFEHCCLLIHKYYHSMCIKASHKLHTHTTHLDCLSFSTYNPPMKPFNSWNFNTVSIFAQQPYHFLQHWGFIIVTQRSYTSHTQTS